MQVNEDVSHAQSDAAVLAAERRSLYAHMYTMLFLALLGFAIALENLNALFRSLMILGVVVVAVVTTSIKVIDYIITRKGSEPEFGLAAVYTAVVALICLGLRWNHERNNRSVNGASSLLRVEATATKMEALISAGICASLVFVAVIPDGTFLTSDRFNIKDIADSIIVLILCAMLVGEPIHQIRLEFGRLSGRRAECVGPLRLTMVFSDHPIHVQPAI